MMKSPKHCISINPSFAPIDIESISFATNGTFSELNRVSKKSNNHFHERRASNRAMNAINPVNPAEIAIEAREGSSALSVSSSNISNVSNVSYEQIIDLAREHFAVWEDELDSLGSSPSLKDLERMLSTAPNRAQPLYRYALSVYNDMLGEAMVAWEDKLDSMGPFPETKDLEYHLSQAPMQHNSLVIFAYGVLAQRVLHE